MLSVIVPAYNEEERLGRLLEALQNQETGDFEVIVVDDGSGDRTLEVARNSKARVFSNPHKGPAWQRNFGAKQAKGEIIVFTDADCVPPRQWLGEMVAPFRNREIAGVSGTYRTLNSGSALARFEGYEIENRHRRMAARRYIDFVSTFSAAYRRDAFLKAGGFDASFPTSSGEDTELSFRLSEMGYKMVLNPAAWVWHPHVSALGPYVRQKFGRAYWRVLLYRKHPEKVAGDSYTGLEVPLSAAAMALFVLSPLFAVIGPLAVSVPALAALLALYAVNWRLLLFLAGKGAGMVALALFLLPLRTLVWMTGFAAGLLASLRTRRP